MSAQVPVPRRPFLGTLVTALLAALGGFALGRYSSEPPAAAPSGAGPTGSERPTLDSGASARRLWTTPPTPAPVAAPPARPRAAQRTPEEWTARFERAPAPDEVRALTLRLTTLDPARGRDVALHLLATLPDPGQRRSVVTAFRRHAYAPAVLDAALKDADPEVRRRAATLLSRLLGFDVAADPARYEAWAQGHRDGTLDEALRGIVAAWVARLGTLRGEALVAEEARSRTYLPDLVALGPAAAEAAREAGLVRLLAAWRADAALPDDVREAGLTWLAPLGLPEAELRAAAEPYLVDPPGTPASMFEGACLLVGKAQQAWAVPALLRAYETTPRRGDWSVLSDALAAVKAMEAVPTMIAVIQADGRDESLYGIGQFGLSRLLGIDYDRKHDAAWWRAWWEANASRFPGVARALPEVRLQAGTDE